MMGCGYNTMVSLDEEVNANWSEVLNQYKRRSELIPNLVGVVKGYAKHEKETLTNVIEARSKATSVQATPELLKDPVAFRKFQSAQNGLSSALSRLMVVAERYPTLKANQQFADLSSALEGTENRLSVSRNRYINAIKSYNTHIRKFPSNITASMFGFKTKPNFSVENESEIKTAPKVSFSD